MYPSRLVLQTTTECSDDQVFQLESIERSAAEAAACNIILIDFNIISSLLFSMVRYVCIFPGRRKPQFAQCSIRAHSLQVLCKQPLRVEYARGAGSSPALVQHIQMLADTSRCLQIPLDASQMPPRCLPDVSRCLQMLPDAFKMRPYCLSLMACLKPFQHLESSIVNRPKPAMMVDNF